MEEYAPIQGYSRYGVRIDGDVINLRTGRRLQHHLTQNGHVYVALSVDGTVQPRILARLVAKAFLPTPPEYFDAVIHHDYNFENNHAANLSWRPRHFAVQYHRQGRDDIEHFFRIHRPIVCDQTGEIFPSSREAAQSFGILEMDLVTKVDANEEVFPIGRTFSFF